MIIIYLNIMTQIYRFDSVNFVGQTTNNPNVNIEGTLNVTQDVVVQGTISGVITGVLGVHDEKPEFNSDKDDLITPTGQEVGIKWWLDSTHSRELLYDIDTDIWTIERTSLTGILAHYLSGNYNLNSIPYVKTNDGEQSFSSNLTFDDSSNSLIVPNLTGLTTLKSNSSLNIYLDHDNDESNVVFKIWNDNGTAYLLQIDENPSNLLTFNGDILATGSKLRAPLVECETDDLDLKFIGTQLRIYNNTTKVLEIPNTNELQLLSGGNGTKKVDFNTGGNSYLYYRTNIYGLFSKVLEYFTDTGSQYLMNTGLQSSGLLVKSGTEDYSSFVDLSYNTDHTTTTALRKINLSFDTSSTVNDSYNVTTTVNTTSKLIKKIMINKTTSLPIESMELCQGKVLYINNTDTIDLSDYVARKFIIKGGDLNLDWANIENVNKIEVAEIESPGNIVMQVDSGNISTRTFSIINGLSNNMFKVDEGGKIDIYGDNIVHNGSSDFVFTMGTNNVFLIAENGHTNRFDLHATYLKLWFILDSSSSTTGGLQLTGGMGIGKKLYIGTDGHIGGVLYVNDQIISEGTGNLTIKANSTTETVKIIDSSSGNLIDFVNTHVKIYPTTDSSSSTTGSLQSLGGLGVAKKAYIGTDLHVLGDLHVSNVQNAFTVNGKLTVTDDLEIDSDIEAEEDMNLIFNKEDDSHTFKIVNDSTDVMEIHDNYMGIQNNGLVIYTNSFSTFQANSDKIATTTSFVSNHDSYPTEVRLVHTHSTTNNFEPIRLRFRNTNDTQAFDHYFETTDNGDGTTNFHLKSTGNSNFLEVNNDGTSTIITGSTTASVRLSILNTNTVSPKSDFALKCYDDTHVSDWLIRGDNVDNFTIRAGHDSIKNSAYDDWVLRFNHTGLGTYDCFMNLPSGSSDLDVNFTSGSQKIYYVSSTRKDKYDEKVFDIPTKKIFDKLQLKSYLRYTDKKTKREGRREIGLILEDFESAVKQQKLKNEKEVLNYFISYDKKIGKGFRSGSLNFLMFDRIKELQKENDELKKLVNKLVKNQQNIIKKLKAKNIL